MHALRAEASEPAMGTLSSALDVPMEPLHAGIGRFNGAMTGMARWATRVRGKREAETPNPETPKPRRANP